MQTDSRPPLTPAQTRQAVAVVHAVAEAIREAGSTPAGPLFAALAATGATVDQFDRIISTLVRAGLVRRAGNMLHWAGPTIGA